MNEESKASAENVAVDRVVIFRQCVQCKGKVSEKEYQSYGTVQAGYAARCKCGWEGSSNWLKIYKEI